MHVHVKSSVNFLTPLAYCVNMALMIRKELSHPNYHIKLLFLESFLTVRKGHF